MKRRLYNICIHPFGFYPIIITARKKNKSKYWELTVFNEKDNSDFEREMIYAEVMDEVMKIIDTMPAACGNIFRKGYLEELTNQEISEELGISVNTVKT